MKYSRDVGCFFFQHKQWINANGIYERDTLILSEISPVTTTQKHIVHKEPYEVASQRHSSSVTSLGLNRRRAHVDLATASRSAWISTGLLDLEEGEECGF